MQPLNEAQTQAAITAQITEAERRISDLQYMQATGKLANEDYYVADAGIIACRKLIIRLRIGGAIRRWNESESA
jgi:hypothetical protein